MAYAGTFTTRAFHLPGGEEYLVVSITETGNTGVGDELELTGMPYIGTVTEVYCTLTTGAGASATQVDPQIGEDTNTNTVYENASAGTAPHSGSLQKYYTVLDGSLWWRAKANGTLGTNGTVVSQVTIRLGHF